jgi:hypothetical protein
VTIRKKNEFVYKFLTFSLDGPNSQFKNWGNRPSGYINGEEWNFGENFEISLDPYKGESFRFYQIARAKDGNYPDYITYWSYNEVTKSLDYITPRFSNSDLGHPYARFFKGDTNVFWQHAASSTKLKNHLVMAGFSRKSDPNGKYYVDLFKNDPSQADVR